MPNDTTPAPIGADAALAQLVAAVEAETDPGWDCNSYHPSLWPALKAARAALASAAQPAAVPHAQMTEEIDNILSDPDTRLSPGAERALRWLRTWTDAPLVLAAAPKAAPAAVAGPSDAEPLHITHGPLMRHAAALLRSRKPVPPDQESVAAELELAADGHPTPAGDPSPEWLEVAESAMRATAPTTQAAPAAVAHQGVVVWPVMPPSKRQSPVLFEDGYAEGWAKCLDACKAALASASTTQATSPAVVEPFTVAQRERMFRNRPSDVGKDLSLADWHRVLQYVEAFHGIGIKKVEGNA